MSEEAFFLLGGVLAAVALGVVAGSKVARATLAPITLLVLLAYLAPGG